MFDINTNIGSSDYPKPSVIKDPFQLNNIRKLFIHSMIGIGGEWIHTGEVEFINGQTQGTQKFKGDTTDEVIFKIKEFLKQLQQHEQQASTRA